MKPNQLIPVLLLIIASLAVSCASEPSVGQHALEATEARPLKQFNTVVAKPKTLDQTVIVTGKLSAIDRLEVFAQVQGIAGLEAGRFKAGQFFKAGETLLTIDKTEFESNLNAQRSQFMSSLLNLMADIKSELSHKPRIAI